MPDVDEVTESRASRRGRPRAVAIVEPVEEPAPALQLIRALAVAAVAGFVVLASHAEPWLLASLLAWAGAGLAWGWPAITGLTVGWRAGAVIAGTGMLAAAATGFVTDAPFLRLVPVALAMGLVAMFLLQLVRKDGRPELTDEVVATCGGLGVLGAGACLVPLSRMGSGPAVVTIAMAAVTASLLVELAGTRPALRAWLVPLAMVLGGAAGLAVALALDALTWGAGLLLGMFAGALSYAVRRLVEVQPRGGEIPAQVASAIASVLLVGALPNVAALVFG